MDWQLLLSLILCSADFFSVQSYSVESKLKGDDSLDGVINALQERLAILERAVASNDVNDQFNDLRRELQDVKQENKRLRQRLLRQEENLEQFRRDNHHLCLQKLSPHSAPLTNQRMLQRPTLQKIKNIVSVDRNVTDDSRTTMRATRDSRAVMGAKGDGKSLSLSPGVKPVSIKNDSKIRGHWVKRQVQEGQVAFHSQVSVTDLVNLGIHQTIIFDRVVTNIGGGYHPNTGIFTAPISGVYVFHVSAMSSPGKYQYLLLTKDGAGIQILFANAAGYYDSASITVPLELGKGSEVWVQTETGMGTIHGDTFTIFTGFLLYPM